MLLSTRQKLIQLGVKTTKKKYLFGIGAFLLIFFALPNLLNFRERRFFSDGERLTAAKELTLKHSDSVDIIPGEYYQRGEVHQFFFGKKNRDIWATSIAIKVLHLDSAKGGLSPYEIGGSQQTISVRLTDSAGRHWVLRSVNKDQQNALPELLRYSALRFMFRDQVASMNSYAPVVVASLAEAVQLPHNNPQLFWMPYDQKYGEYNDKIAGRAVYLEENIDSTWINQPFLGNAVDIVNTEEMFKRHQIPVDTLLYLKTRLFDMLICDWDRHEDQWRWALIDSAGKKRFMPIAKDRDMAMYVFDEGILSHITLAINNKFQSFRKDITSVDGLTHQAKKIDQKILKGVAKEKFIASAKELQSQLTASAIGEAFNQYPPEIRKQFAAEHQQILTSRLAKLTTVAEEFWKLVND